PSVWLGLTGIALVVASLAAAAFAGGTNDLLRALVVWTLPAGAAIATTLAPQGGRRGPAPGARLPQHVAGGAQPRGHRHDRRGPAAGQPDGSRSHGDQALRGGGRRGDLRRRPARRGRSAADQPRARQPGQRQV